MSFTAINRANGLVGLSVLSVFCSLSAATHARAQLTTYPQYQPPAQQQPYPAPAQQQYPQPYSQNTQGQYPTQQYPTQQYPQSTQSGYPVPYPAQPYQQQYQQPNGGLAPAYAPQQFGGGLSWVPMVRGGVTPPNVVYGGTESNGNMEFVCRGYWGGGMQAGKSANGWCYVPYGQDEIKLSTFDVLVGRARWGAPNQFGANPVVAGQDNSYTYRVCRGNLYVNGQFVGREIGKYLPKGCQVSYGGHAYYVGNFEELYSQ